MNQDELLGFYTAPGQFTGLQAFADQVDHVSSDAESLARIVQGLLIHEGLTAAYGVSMSPARVPITNPELGVNPIEVSTHLPPLMAAMLAPFPR